MFLKSNTFDRIKLPFRKDRELYASFYEILGFYPHRIKYYKQALQHKSTAGHVRRSPDEHNERLEFLGDAILEAIVSDIVYHHFKGQREGFLTNTRSKIVKRETLNQLANETGLYKLIRSNSHSSSHNNNMGGNAFEALIGAIYLDRGYDACMHFISRRILKHLINIDTVAAKEVNFKSKLIEWSQKHHVNYEFRLEEEQRADHASPVFITRVILEGLECETGKGYSKKESHQQAAQATLIALRQDRILRESIFAAKEERVIREAESTVPQETVGEESIVEEPIMEEQA